MVKQNSYIVLYPSMSYSIIDYYYMFSRECDEGSQRHTVSDL